MADGSRTRKPCPGCGSTDWRKADDVCHACRSALKRDAAHQAELEQQRANPELVEIWIGEGPSFRYAQAWDAACNLARALGVLPDRSGPIWYPERWDDGGIATLSRYTNDPERPWVRTGKEYRTVQSVGHLRTADCLRLYLPQNLVELIINLFRAILKNIEKVSEDSEKQGNSMLLALLNDTDLSIPRSVSMFSLQSRIRDLEAELAALRSNEPS